MHTTVCSSVQEYTKLYKSIQNHTTVHRVCCILCSNHMRVCTAGFELWGVGEGGRGEGGGGGGRGRGEGMALAAQDYAAQSSQ